MKMFSSDLAIVCRWSFPESSGGVAMHNYNLIKAINSKIRCQIFSLESKSNELFYNELGIKYSGIKINSVYNNPHLLKLKFLKNTARYLSDNNISKIFRKKVNGEIGLVEFMDIHSEGYHFLKNKRGKRTNVIIRSHTPFSLLRKFFTKDELKGVDTLYTFEREKKCFEMADQITTPSQDLKKQIINLFNLSPDKINVIPNILDTTHFRPIEIRKKKKFNILHVGRFERPKGVETMIKAFIEVAKEYNDINLINIGQPRGPSFNICQHLLNENNLTDRVTFKGYVDYNSLPEYYSISDLVIAPSEIYESFSYTVAQGMACGRPVIASKIGGIPQTLNNGIAGLLFNPGDVNDLTEKIITIYNNREHRDRLGKKARKFAVNQFSIDVLSKRYLEYYKSIKT